MHVGIAGIGNMGSNIGARLMEVGHTLTVWNRTAEKTKPLAEAGAAVAKTPAELTSAVDVVISLLIDTAAIDAVYHGPQGLLAGGAKEKLFIEMSTVTPEAQAALAEKVRGKGAAFVECPVSGSVIPARAGKLLGLMGAEPADAARARPLLEQICRRVMHAGPIGSGALLKLAVNLPLMIYWQALGEQLSLCKTLTIGPAELLDNPADGAHRHSDLSLGWQRLSPSSYCSEPGRRAEVFAKKALSTDPRAGVPVPEENPSVCAIGSAPAIRYHGTMATWFRGSL